MTENERQIEQRAIEQEEYARCRQTQIFTQAINRAARLIEHNADEIMIVAETNDPRVKRAFYNLAKKIRNLKEK